MISKGARLLYEKLEIIPEGFRAPYHQYGRSLFLALDDLGFLYDSSVMDWNGFLFSYFPPVRAVWIQGKKGLEGSAMFHPLNLQLMEIPVALDFSWYNLGFEVNAFNAFLKRVVFKKQTRCLVVSSHIGALSASGLTILENFFLSLKQAGLKSSALREVAWECRASELRSSYCA
jgi:hypothetical protein